MYGAKLTAVAFIAAASFSYWGGMQGMIRDLSYKHSLKGGSLSRFSAGPGCRSKMTSAGCFLSAHILKPQKKKKKQETTAITEHYMTTL